MKRASYFLSIFITSMLLIAANFCVRDAFFRSEFNLASSFSASLNSAAFCESAVSSKASSRQPNKNILSAENLSAAVSTPHVVVGDNIWLLNGDGEKLFLLPKTYYAEITSLDETYYFVTFNGISGKVPKNSVRSVGYHTQASGTSESLKIDDAYAEFTRLSLKERPDRSSKTVAEMPTKDSFTFVGIYPKEEDLWYAVRYNEHFGYLRASLTSKKEMTFPDFVPEAEPPDDNTATTDPVNGGSDGSVNEKEGFNPLTVILVVGLTLPAVFIIFLLFRKDSKKPKRFD